MKTKNIIVIVVTVLVLAGAVLLFCLTRGDTAPDTPPELTETENTEPTIIEPVITLIEDDKSRDNKPTGEDIPEIIIDVAEHDNGHRDTPSVVGEVYINPGHKEDTSE